MIAVDSAEAPPGGHAWHVWKVGVGCVVVSRVVTRHQLSSFVYVGLCAGKVSCDNSICLTYSRHCVSIFISPLQICMQMAKSSNVILINNQLSVLSWSSDYLDMSEMDRYLMFSVQSTVKVIPGLNHITVLLGQVQFWFTVHDTPFFYSCLEGFGRNEVEWTGKAGNLCRQAKHVEQYSDLLSDFTKREWKDPACTLLTEGYCTSVQQIETVGQCLVLCTLSSAHSFDSFGA